VDQVTAAVQALQQERALYQDDPAKRQQIEGQERQLLSGITSQEWQSAKLAQADASTLMEVLGFVGAPALTADIAGALTRVGVNGGKLSSGAVGTVDGAGGVVGAPKTIPYQPTGSVVLQGNAPVCGPACAAMVIKDETGNSVSLQDAIGSFSNGVRPTGVSTVELSKVISNAGVANRMETDLLPSQLNRALANGQTVIVQVPAGNGYHFMIVDGVQSVDGIGYYMTRDPYVGPRGVQVGILNNVMAHGVNAIVIGE
jgi:filamentous hemagglutinin